MVSQKIDFINLNGHIELEERLKHGKWWGLCKGHLSKESRRRGKKGENSKTK